MEDAQAHTVTAGQCWHVATVYPADARPGMRSTCTRLASRHANAHVILAARNRCLAMNGRDGLGWGACDALARVRPVWAASEALHELLRRESGWSPNAVNEGSGACGLFQRLPCPWSYYGGRPEPGDDRVYANPRLQVANGVRYIDSRYGTPVQALNHHNRMGWY